MYCRLEFNQSYWLKPYRIFNTKKEQKRKKSYKDKKASYKLRNNTGYGNAMKIFTIRIIIKLVSNKIWTSKLSYMSQTTFDNDLIALSKSKVTLKLSKPSFAWMCILDLGKLLICDFHFDYFKNKYYSKSKYG